jgi:hypothetical protein
MSFIIFTFVLTLWVNWAFVWEGVQVLSLITSSVKLNYISAESYPSKLDGYDTQPVSTRNAAH